ncbi:MlaD family protein [Salinisphaera hydrothermalis]|uniref:Mce-like protein n=1 Tax=Salinisphaera hydrothermalis (strain C41B8) TaxID=1304275 RepID=A0A084INE6_SALHC|nr:MlaD family protein [Salinisphaera hydrothermalis]KEZ78230.1 Mce-like protein [Salinisphaera hydrothermalis C41B8]
MENRSHIVAAVIFILFFGGGAVGFFFWLSTGDNAHRTMIIETTQSVGGVSAESPVKFKGLKVGHIESVSFDPQDANKVRIVFKVRDSVPLTKSSYGELATQGITGMSTLTLKTPDPSGPKLTGNPPQLPLHKGLLGRLKSRGQADLHKVSQILDQVQNLTGGKNAKHISDTLAQLNQATRQLTEAEKQLQPTLAQLPELTRQLRRTVDSVDHLTDKAIPAIQKAGQAAQSAQSVGQSSQDVMRNLNNQVLPHIDALTRQMQDTARQIQNLGAELSAKPQSVLTGPPARRPGPGEPGFHATGGQ